MDTNGTGYKISKLKLWVRYHITQSRFRYIFSGIVAFIGFVLSPLSWWNDLFINVPLAYGFAWLIAKGFDLMFVVHKPLFTMLFALGYLITNILGFLMIHYAVINASKREKAISIKSQLLISLAYTAIIILLGYLDIFTIFGEGYTIFPDFVQ